MKIQSNNNYPVIIEQDENKIFIVSCPLFKGCHSYGKTIDEAMKNIQEVIEMCIEEIDASLMNKYIGFKELQIKAA